MDALISEYWYLIVLLVLVVPGMKWIKPEKKNQAESRHKES